MKPRTFDPFAEGRAVAVATPRDASADDSSRFETPLSDQDEVAFQTWKQQHAPNDSGADYDLRGAFKAGITPGPNGHWPDTFKKPNHPTFSDESIYAKDRPDLAGHWNGETFLPPRPAAGAQIPEEQSFDPFASGEAVPAGDFDPFAQGLAVPDSSPSKVGDAGRALVRGAGEGFYRGVEGVARASANAAPLIVQDLNPKSELGRLQAEIEQLEGWNKRLIPEDDSREGNYAPTPAPDVQNQYWDNVSRIAKLKDAKEALRRGKAAASVAGQAAEAYRETRESIRAALPVSPEFEQSLGGQIIEGVGQAVGTLPTFVIPGFGPAHSMGQLYQQAYDDATAHGANPSEAHAAGMMNVPVAAVDVLADRLAIGKILKPLRGRVKLGALVQDVMKAASAQGVSNGAQQLWMNLIASRLAGYDPERTLDDEVIRSIIVGATVGAVVTSGGQFLTGKAGGHPADVETSRPGVPVEEAGGGTRPAMGREIDPTAPETAEATAARVAAEKADAAQFVDALGAKLDPEGQKLSESEAAARAGEEPSANLGAPEAALRTEAQSGEVLADPQAPSAEVADGAPSRAAAIIQAAQEAGESGAMKLTPWQRLAAGRFAFEGAADVMERTGHPLGRRVSAAMRQHTDLADEFIGRLAEPFEQVLGPANSLRSRLAAGNPVADAPAVKQAKREFEAYFRARENRQKWVKDADGEWARVDDPENVAAMRAVMDGASPLGARLIHSWERTAEMTGNLSQKVGVQVFDAGEKRWRPIGNLGANFFPRRIRGDVRRVIADPESNPRLLRQLTEDLYDQGRSEKEVKAILTPGSEDLASSNDFMGNLEKSREGMLPESFYEYRFDPVVKGFIGNYAERLAQIASYGQKTTHDSFDLFDIAERKAADSFTRRYIAQAREQAYGRRSDGALARFMARAGTVATGSMLSNPVSSLRNLVSGLYGTAELAGLGRAIDAMGEVSKPALEMDAKHLGVLKANLLDAQFFEDFDTANDRSDRVLRKATEIGLRFGGYTGTETFIRKHATAAAMQFVTDGVRAYRDNPNSKVSREFLAHAVRLGLDGEKIAGEGLDFRNGLESRAFVRRQVKEAQGGYRFDQVPLWANSPAGRFLYQFGRWGTQRTRALYRSMWVPAVFGTEVRIHGRKERVRNVRPLLLAGTGAVLTGSIFAAIADTLFDRERPDASFSEIAERLDDDTAGALGALGDRISNDLVTGGMLGIAGQPIAAGRELTVFNRVRNPLAPPGVQVFGNLMDVVYSALDEGGLPTSRALLRAAENQFSGLKNAKDATLNMAAKAGADWDAARAYQARQDQRLLRNLTWRFAKEEGVDATRSGFGGGGVVRRTATSAVYDSIQEALAAGDADEARRLAEKYLESFETEEAFNRGVQSLRAAVRSRQPFRVGMHNGEDLRVSFFDWASTRLPADQLERVLRVDQGYYEAALRAGLMKPRTDEEETRWRAEMKRATSRRLSDAERRAGIAEALRERMAEEGIQR